MLPDHTAFETALVLTGPTGSGKSALALRVAAALDAEIVAMDSMTLYRGMDVGTAKPTAAERAAVPHHLLDRFDPHESASVAWWLQAAAVACADIAGRGKRPLIVGGTPLYLKALLFGLFDGPPADPALRAELAAVSEVELHARLAAVDPASAARLHPHDRRRVTRALEVFSTTGRPLSDWQREWAGPPRLSPTVDLPTGSEPRVVWLDWPRDVLYQRIDARTAAMLAAGWLDEVGRLLALDRPPSREAWAALGYAELAAVRRGEVTVAEARTLIQQKSRNYAKRQLTWFRGLPAAQSRRVELTTPLWGVRMSATE